MTNLKNEIRLMQLYLTGYEFSTAELDMMSNRDLRDLHANLKGDYEAEIKENMSIFFE